MGFFTAAKATVGRPPDRSEQTQVVTDGLARRAGHDDLLWEPIEGVDLYRFSQLMAALTRQDLTDVEQVNAWLATQGIPAGTWGRVNRGWIHRMVRNAPVRDRFGVLFDQLK